MNNHSFLKGDLSMVPSNMFVCLLGLTIVFFGLFCIVLICYLVHFICDKIAPHLLQPTSTDSLPIDLPPKH